MSRADKRRKHQRRKAFANEEARRIVMAQATRSGITRCPGEPAPGDRAQIACGGPMRPIKIAGTVQRHMLRCAWCGRDGVLVPVPTAAAPVPETAQIAAPDEDTPIACLTCCDRRVISYRAKDLTEFSEPCPDCSVDGTGDAAPSN